jgi:hypothetical protein
MDMFHHLSAARRVSPVDRRTFVSRAGQTVAGLALLPLVAPLGPLLAGPGRSIAVARAGAWTFLLKHLKALSKAVTYGVVTDSVSQWVTSLSASQKDRVDSGNGDLVQRGYLNPLGRSLPIYGENEKSLHCVYYPVLSPDELNGIVPFYDFCSCTCRALLATPSIFGLGQAAADFGQENGFDGAQVAAYMIPDKQHSASYGKFADSYTTPDRFVSENNTRVRVNYQRQSADLGDVRVVAKIDHLKGTKTIFDASYVVRLA